eukprot:CAMPEP_0181312318 /NCGR_PEP_ID=MMETSP1101-20121128/13630_1 /TAXON_ID=46948 /ORGANISM="Rhodomonas abbreviata, Strain Caron Lab Isolate" /LENGTH=211 /DNA_ID=CAMNT_0023419155 /DNA_START=37 /DNA_END=673 /DNA_ORIENTATION=-
MAQGRGWRAHPAVLPLLGSLAVCMLLVLAAIGSSSRKAVLLEQRHSDKVQNTALKSVSRRVDDPVEWEHQRRYKSLTKSLASPHHQGARKIPDPAEWLSGKVMAKTGQKHLAHSVPTAKLHEVSSGSGLIRKRLDQVNADGGFNLPVKSGLKEAEERAKILAVMVCITSRALAVLSLQRHALQSRKKRGLLLGGAHEFEQTRTEDSTRADR